MKVWLVRFNGEWIDGDIIAIVDDKKATAETILVKLKDLGLSDEAIQISINNIVEIDPTEPQIYVKVNQDV